MNKILNIMILIAAWAVPASAQLSPPTIASSRPIGAVAGESFALEIKGTDLDGVKALEFEDADVRVENLEASKAQVKARVTVPRLDRPGPLAFRVSGPRGVSNAARLFVGMASRTVAEVEPNRGFRKPQAAGIGDAIEGKIEPGDDVDVYAVDMKEDETLAAEVIAARAGSGLDALLTIFGPDGRVLAEADDSAGKDAAASIKAAKAGRHFVQVQDADGRNRDANIENKKTRPYRLELAAEARAVEPVAVAEVEPNDDERHAQVLSVPGSWMARLDHGKGRKREADVDVFRLLAAPGSEGTYRISAAAATIGSPADPVLAVLDESGEVKQESDDARGRDAQLLRPVDTKGVFISVRDYHGRGGARFVYRLEAERLPARGIAINADLGARAVPRGGSVALPLSLERRDDPGPITVVAGETPDGISIPPLTFEKGQNAGVMIVSSSEDAKLGRFPLRLTARDTGASVAYSYRERLPIDGEPAGGWLAVVEPASLGIRFEPAEIAVVAGGKASVKVVLDRRGEGAKSAVIKLKFVNVDGLESFAEATAPKGSDSITIDLKPRKDAQPGPRRLIVVARFEANPETAGVAAALPLTVEP